VTVAGDRGDKATQRAVLSFLLAEWPAQHSGFSLMWMGFGDFEELREALRFLHMAELRIRDRRRKGDRGRGRTALRLAETPVTPSPAARL